MEVGRNMIKRKVILDHRIRSSRVRVDLWEVWVECSEVIRDRVLDQ